MNQTAPLLLLRDLVCGYQEQKVVQELNLHLKQGDIGCLLGPSGCGKTTTLRAIAGFEPVQAGAIELNGDVISKAGFTLAPEKRRIGMVFQDYALFPHLSVEDNVAFGIHRDPQAARITAELLDLVKLGALAKRFPHELSGGQQQRLCIARGVAVKPDILLLDEPTSALDPISTAKIEELVFELKNSYTIAIVTHNMQQAARVSDYTAYMYLGELIEFGVTDELFVKPKRKETEDYITGRFG